jgi:hypothetical protein
LQFRAHLPTSPGRPEPLSVLRLRRSIGNQFPKLDAAEWLAAAKRGWREEAGRLVSTYDPALGDTLQGFDPDKPFPTLWPQFDAMAQVPLSRARLQFRYPE